MKIVFLASGGWCRPIICHITGTSSFITPDIYTGTKGKPEIVKIQSSDICNKDSAITTATMPPTPPHTHTNARPYPLNHVVDS